MSSDSRPELELSVAPDVLFTSFYNTHAGELVQLAYFLLQDRGAAEQIAQDVLVELSWHWAEIDPSSRLAHAGRAVIIRSRNLIRRRAAARWLSPRRASRRLSRPSPESPSGDHPWVRDGGGHLSRRQREALLLRYWLDQCDGSTAPVAPMVHAVLAISPGDASGVTARPKGTALTSLAVLSALAALLLIVALPRDRDPGAAPAPAPAGISSSQRAIPTVSALTPVRGELSAPRHAPIPAAELPWGERASEPVPRVENPVTGNPADSVLVLQAGRVTLRGVRSGWPLAVTGDTVLVGVHGDAFTGGDLDDDFRVLAFAPDRAQREVFRGAAGAVRFSLDARLMVVSRDLASMQGGGVSVIDVRSGQSVAHLAGAFHALAVSGDPQRRESISVVLRSHREQDSTGQNLLVWQVTSPQPTPITYPDDGWAVAITTGAGIVVSERCVRLLDPAAAAITHELCSDDGSRVSVVGPASPGGDVVPIAWTGPQISRVGALSLRTGAVTWWPVTTQEVRYWADAQSAVLVVRSAEGTVKSALRCSTTTGQCTRIAVPKALVESTMQVALLP